MENKGESLEKLFFFSSSRIILVGKTKQIAAITSITGLILRRTEA